MRSVITERTRLLVQLENLLEKPMVILSIVWVIVVAVELTRGLSRTGEIASMVIWAAFLVDFAVKFAVAPRKMVFLRRNVITLLALALPAFRLLRAGRAFRVARVLRGVRLAKFLGSINRGMRAVRRSMRRHGFGYVLILTLLVLFAGAAGMMSFEREGDNQSAFGTYADSLWWTAMIMTTLGSEAWPRTEAGRILTLFIAIYAFAVFGYITATLASLFIEQQDSRSRQSSSLP